MNNSPQSTAIRIEDLLQHRSWLERLARQLVLDDALADDLVQETWLAALEGSRGPVSDPRAWLGGVTRNLFRNRSRREALRRDSERRAARPEAESSDVEALATLQHGLTGHVLALDEPYRGALLARYFEGLQPRQIAARRGEPVATVKSRLARGLAQLRERLDVEHGDRRSWGLALLPLARPKGGASLGSFVGVAAGVLALVGLTWVLVLWSESQRDLREGRGAGLSQLQAPAPSEGRRAIVAVIPEREVDSSERESAPVAARAVELTAVEEASSTLIAAALVRYVDLTELSLDESEAGELVLDLEALGEAYGTSVPCDARGRASFEVHGAWFARVQHEDSLASVYGTGEAATVEARLRRVPRLVARVVDEDGRPQPGVPVAADFTVASSGGFDGRATPFRFRRTSAQDGTVSFWDSMGHWTSGEALERHIRLAGDGEQHEGRWSSLRIDLPGVPAGSVQAGRGLQRLEFGVLEPNPPGPLELVLPATGALEVWVQENDGRGFTGEGEVTLSARGGAYDSYEWRYETELVAGRASFPRVALGFDYEARVRLPRAGADWSVRGPGPREAGQVLRLIAQREARPVLRARLVSSGGAPRVGVQVDVRLAPSEERQHEVGVGQVVTGDDGHMTLELDPELPMNGPLAIVVYQGLERDWARVDLGTTARLGDIDLGELELHAARYENVRGRCLDEQGEPVSGVRISSVDGVTGTNYGTESDAQGRFTVRRSLDGVTRIECDRWQESGLLALEPVLTVEAASDDVEFRMALGGSLELNLSLPNWWPDRQYAVPLLLSQTDEGLFYYPQGGEDGHWSVEGLRPGVYTFEYRLVANAPVATVMDVQVRAGETTRDPRIDGLNLDALTRLVEVSVSEFGGADLTRRSSLVARSQAGQLNAVNDRGRIVLPRGEGFELVVSAPECRMRSVTVPAGASMLEVVLEPGLPVELRHVSRTGATEGPSSAGYELRHEGDESIVVPLPDGLRAAGAGTVRFPAPGRYRLLRQRNSLHGGGLASASKQELDALIEVSDTPEPQHLEIDLDAGPRP